MKHQRLSQHNVSGKYYPQVQIGTHVKLCVLFIDVLVFSFGKNKNCPRDAEFNQRNKSLMVEF